MKASFLLLIELFPYLYHAVRIVRRKGRRNDSIPNRTLLTASHFTDNETHKYQLHHRTMLGIKHIRFTEKLINELAQNPSQARRWDTSSNFARHTQLRIIRNQRNFLTTFNTSSTGRIDERMDRKNELNKM